MSKYNFIFKLERIDGDNEFLTHGIAGCDIKAIPLERAEQLVALIVQNARDLEAEVEQEGSV